MRTPVKNFQISAQGVFQAHQTAKKGIFKRGACSQGIAQTAQFWAIRFGDSRHPKDVQFVDAFWSGVRFGY